MAFIRFVLAERNADSGVADGIFKALYDLLDEGELTATERAELHETSRWFNANLRTPDRFNRSKSKGYFRRNARGIAWFRDTATEHIRRMHQVKQIAEHHGYLVEVITEARIGYIVYEDDHQVIAEPFAETSTGK